MISTSGLTTESFPFWRKRFETTQHETEAYTWICKDCVNDVTRVILKEMGNGRKVQY